MFQLDLSLCKFNRFHWKLTVFISGNLIASSNLMESADWSEIKLGCMKVNSEMDLLTDMVDTSTLNKFTPVRGKMEKCTAKEN